MVQTVEVKDELVRDMTMVVSQMGELGLGGGLEKDEEEEREDHGSGGRWQAGGWQAAGGSEHMDDGVVDARIDGRKRGAVSSLQAMDDAIAVLKIGQEGAIGCVRLGVRRMVFRVPGAVLSVFALPLLRVRELVFLAVGAVSVCSIC